MKITVTGASSGVGLELCKQFSDHEVTAITRQQLDLSDIDAVLNYDLASCDILINCAGTGVGGKTDFVNHRSELIVDIINTNLTSPLLLSQKALRANANCKIVNITSTNNNRYYKNDLAYSLSKQALANFGAMLKVEYDNVNYLEIRLGLTKTNFNRNRYQYDQDRFQDIYVNSHLTAESAAKQIASAVLSDNIKFLEVAP